MQKITSRRFIRTLSIIVLTGSGIACKNDSQIESAATPAATAIAPVAAAPKAAPAQIATPAALEITGSWKWSVDAGGTVINHSAKFRQAGQLLSGTWTDSFGDQPVTAEIKEGSVKDGQVNFKVNRPSPFGDGSEMTLTFAGKLANDKIDGTINVLIPGADPIPSEWHAARVKE